ncbi:hypothetical protein MJO28_016426 [Puccinia striiformis f. sp. tritici]|uniref:Uncharacterized protein n=3 Tax=Puccinia striiformis TaxID=27350 RepID=A0A0L0UQB5_9BASI|nr:hypothetical protein Pst134EA_030460 [Puccinia striiformis f. sp. tritici]KAI9602123.1 hypothetical protein KEM48_000150 [Puccinia striiformis f. sp. tritici PST-130]KNE89282.1 hypothetical protein PSTG_17258 [Puccinia striiformis f. sp. tritici PST-78]KAH9440378.1 hypothetical protein Pst134EB_030996 [Puccinia striiformis f. sp. tritici]KAH9446547.1 hypothetical protein Pst134EA_030460 [Puccinia striiformis f. sp. tritici]KAI7934945.1 hypothetical protein MJO29_016208 [Puccinia striiformis
MTSIIRFIQRGVLSIVTHRPQTHRGVAKPIFYSAHQLKTPSTTSPPSTIFSGLFRPLLRSSFIHQTGLPLKTSFYFGSSQPGTLLRSFSTIPIRAFSDSIINAQANQDDISVGRLPFEFKIKDPIVDEIMHDIVASRFSFPAPSFDD